MKVVIVSNTSWYLYNFRSNFIKYLISLNCSVHIISPLDQYVNKLLELGVEHHDIKLNRFKKNILQDLYFMYRLFVFNYKIKPDIIHNFTIKPVIYGSIAAWFFPSIKVINSIPGLGVLFINKDRFSISNTLIKWLYKIAILKRYKIIFQNSNDMNYFIKNHILTKKQSFLIKGSGVDLIKFQESKIKKDNQCVVFGMMCRMLWSKGVKEFIDSSRIVFNKNCNTKFLLLGSPDSNSPDSVSLDWLQKINNESHIIWMPHTDNVLNFLNEIDVFVLPTYYPEGLPKSLLEAAAMKLPLITTDTPGCREIVKDQINGYLIDIKNSTQLSEKMYNLSTDYKQRKKMGHESRKIVENEYDVELVNKKTITLYNN